MKIIRQYTDVPLEQRGAVVALGNFDGVHHGHREVINRAKAHADTLGVPLGVIVFEPHPREFFRRDDKPFRLTSLSLKARLLEKEGVDVLYVLTFDKAMAAMLAQDFISEVLVRALGVVHVVTGYDFRFGQGRGGDVSVISYMGDEEGFGVTIVDPVSIQVAARPDNDDEIFSSTRVRNCLRSGRPAEAARLLGHFWTIEGVVQKGDQRGRTIGFPTANLSMTWLVEPALGVYAVKVEVLEGPEAGVYDGVANIGRRPTFDKEDILLEAHIFSFSADLYGRPLAVSIVDFIRPERKFDGIDALKDQIRADCRSAKEILADIKMTA
jgi:riboflavin kinase / FMN adenylyltransferase